MNSFTLEFIKQNYSKGFTKRVSHNSMKFALEVVRLNGTAKDYVNEYIAYGVSVCKSIEDGSYNIDFIIKEEDGAFVVYEMTMECYKKYEMMYSKEVDLSDVNEVSKDTDHITLLTSILFGESVEVGYRATCGNKVDNTYKKHQLFIKSLDKLRKKGYLITETSNTHGNRYATSNGGFWNSSNYQLIKPE